MKGSYDVGRLTKVDTGNIMHRECSDLRVPRRFYTYIVAESQIGKGTVLSSSCVLGWTVTVCAPSTCVHTRVRLPCVRDAQPDLLITRVARNIRSVRVSQRPTNFNKFRLRSGVTCAYNRADISIKSKGNRIRRSADRDNTVFHEAFSRPQLNNAPLDLRINWLNWWNWRAEYSGKKIQWNIFEHIGCRLWPLNHDRNSNGRITSLYLRIYWYFTMDENFIEFFERSTSFRKSMIL